MDLYNLTKKINNNKKCNSKFKIKKNKNKRTNVSDQLFGHVLFLVSCSCKYVVCIFTYIWYFMKVFVCMFIRVRTNVRTHIYFLLLFNIPSKFYTFKWNKETIFFCKFNEKFFRCPQNFPIINFCGCWNSKYSLGQGIWYKITAMQILLINIVWFFFWAVQQMWNFCCVLGILRWLIHMYVCRWILKHILRFDYS